MGIETSCIRQNATENQLSSLEIKVDQYMSLEVQQGFSGVIAISTESGQKIYRAYGYSDKDREFKNNVNTVFDIGSLTKQFTGAAILKLEEEGRLSVNDSIFKYFPTIPDDKKNITIHQLLTHSSGLPFSLGSDSEKLNSGIFVERTFATDLLFIPGEKYSYSHAGYSLLGVLIERVSGIKYEEYLSTRFFTPLGMNSTGYVLPNWDFSNIAIGYRKCRNWGKPMDLNWGTAGPYWNLKANGGLLSTAEDLMKWQESLKTTAVLEESELEKFFYPHIREGDAESHYSYGWVIIKSKRGTNVYAHEGGNGKYQSDWINYPDDNVSILVLANDWRPGYDRVATELAKIIFDPYHEPEINLVKVDCYSTFPENLIGQYGQEFVNLLKSGDSALVEDFATRTMGNYVFKKYSNEFIFGTLKYIQKDCGPLAINQIFVINNRFMEVTASRKSDNQDIKIQFTFDKDDSYKIKRLWYKSP